MGAELCKTCVHTNVCGRDKNIVGDVYAPPSPVFFDEEYRKNAWENFKKREAEGFPCDEYLPTIAPKRGKWIPEQPASSNGGTYAVIRYVICSECQFQMPLWEMNYCPNCGARMEGEEDE